MLIHPDIHREIAGQRERELLATAERDRRRRVMASYAAHWSCEEVVTAADHFGRRENDGIVVDLFWSRRDRRDVFRVEVDDEREGAHFVLDLRTGREAIQAFYHPFAAVGTARAISLRAPRQGARHDRASSTG